MACQIKSSLHSLASKALHDPFPSLLQPLPHFPQPRMISFTRLFTPFHTKRASEPLLMLFLLSGMPSPSDKCTPTHPSVPSSNTRFSRKFSPRQKPLLSLGSTASSFPSLTGAQHILCCHFPWVCRPHMSGINLRAETRFELFLDSQH